MKWDHVMAAAVAAILASGAAAAANISHEGFEKWGRIHEINLCADGTQRNEDAEACCRAGNAPAPVATPASRDGSLCRAGQHLKGDADPGQAQARMHLSVTVSGRDNVD